MVSRRRFLLVSAATATAFSLPALADDAPPIKQKQIDRHNAASDIEYRLVFIARASGAAVTFPGHAFLLVGEYDNVQNVCRFDKNEILGFYPAEDAGELKTWFAFPVPGEVKAKLDLDLDQKQITHRLDIITAQNGYDAAVTAAHAFNSNNQYQLGRTECVKLVEQLLLAVKTATDGAHDDLKVPSKNDSQFPENYLAQLLKANGMDVP